MILSASLIHQVIPAFAFSQACAAEKVEKVW